MFKNDKIQDTSGETLKMETENEFINKARFEQNKDCTSNWIRRVNRKRRDGL
jgi:hypothetical protein